MSQKLTDRTSYEHDDRWAAVDIYTSSHLFAASNNKFHAVLEFAYRNSIDKGLPAIALSPALGRFLSLQAQLAGAKNILEVGTLGGYSSIWLASALPADSRVTTIEVDAKHKEVAEQNIAHAGLSHKISVHLGAGLDVLPKLVDEVKAGTREPFDFVFIDADKENNLAYFDLILPVTRPRTPIFVDNVVRRGKLADEASAEGDSRIAATRELVETVGRNPKVDAVVVQTVSEKSYDGFLLAVVQ